MKNTPDIKGGAEPPPRSFMKLHKKTNHGQNVQKINMKIPPDFNLGKEGGIHEITQKNQNKGMLNLKVNIGEFWG